ncbi:DMT family transporter [Martelella limonii]|uniref:DMT family transporter n=1 Tax=Martelella limonii TaxID=1647649 RepID=UPI0015802CF6|nr:DMT family transporter [Martelella limonii]
MLSSSRSSGAALCIAAVAMLSGVDALAKSLGAALSSFQVVFLRYTVAALLLALFVALFVRQWPKRGQLSAYALRGFLVAATASAFFYGLSGMPLVMALALAMTGPIYMAVLGTLVFGERPGRHLVFAIALAVAGSGLIVFTRGTGLAGPPVALPAILAGLLAPVIYALAAVAMKQNATSEHPAVLSLMQAVFAALFSLPMALVVWQAPPAALSWQIALIGLCGALGFILLLSGLARVTVSLYAVIDYSALVWAGLYGYLFFDEIPTVTTLFGAGLIVAACVLSARPSSGKDKITVQDG